MKGLEKTKLFLDNPDDIIKFFNSSAENFYRGQFIFVGKQIDFANKFKSDLLYFLVETERVIKATFNSTLNLVGVNLEHFRKMFPNIVDGIFCIKNEDDLLRFGNILKVFRNINAHSICSLEDYKVFKSDFSGLEKQKVFNLRIKYFTDDHRLSVAGLVFIIANMGRDRSIKSLTTKNRDIGLITMGKSGIDDGEKFVEKISQVNWEIKIRDDDKKTLEGAVFGDLLESAKTDTPLCYELLDGNEDFYEHKYYVNIGQNRIYVHKNTLSNVLYENDYDLRIDDTKHFLELANQYPPFIFVDLLYKLKITCFDKKAYEKITNDGCWESHSKPMYSKFYIDKNIDILLADKSKADLRINSNVCNGALHAIFMKLEKLIIKFYKIDLREIKYSKIGNLLKDVGANSDLVRKTQIIRNMVSHGYNFGEHIYIDGQIVEHNLDSSLKLIIDLIDFFENENKIIANALKNDASSLLINQMLAIKTKLFVRESVTFITNYPNVQNVGELKKKENFYNNSSISPKDFAELNKKVNGDLRCILVTSKKFETKLALINNEKGNALLQELLSKTNQSIIQEQNDGVVRYIVIG